MEAAGWIVAEDPISASPSSSSIEDAAPELVVKEGAGTVRFAVEQAGTDRASCLYYIRLAALYPAAPWEFDMAKPPGKTSEIRAEIRAEIRTEW